MAKINVHLDKLEITTTEAKDEMQGAFLLDVMFGYQTLILELSATEDLTLH